MNGYRDGVEDARWLRELAENSRYLQPDSRERMDRIAAHLAAPVPPQPAPSAATDDEAFAIAFQESHFDWSMSDDGSDEARGIARRVWDSARNLSAPIPPDPAPDAMAGWSGDPDLIPFAKTLAAARPAQPAETGAEAVPLLSIIKSIEEARRNIERLPGNELVASGMKIAAGIVTRALEASAAPSMQPAPPEPSERVDEALLRSTDRADVWAREFGKVNPEIDEGLMIGWFANCAENAKDLQRAARPSLDLTDDEIRAMFSEWWRAEKHWQTEGGSGEGKARGAYRAAVRAVLDRLKGQAS